MITAPVRSGLRQTSRTIALRAAFSTSSSPAAPRTEGRDGRRGVNAFDITGIQKFQFDDTTSYGHMILEKKREHLSLLQAIERDRSLLERKSSTLRSSRPFRLYLIQNNENLSSLHQRINASVLQPQSISLYRQMPQLEKQPTPTNPLFMFPSRAYH
jgi:hypothetical protein